MVRNRAKIVITCDDLAALLGYPGGRIFQAKVDNDSLDECLVITMEHDTLPEARPGEVLQNIRWPGQTYFAGFDGNAPYEVIVTG